ncbi:MAG: hypothetical protein JWQ41_3442 [Variovorax sp.]|nr:hypothetical protein [Variovorax sp.]
MFWRKPRRPHPNEVRTAASAPKLPVVQEKDIPAIESSSAGNTGTREMPEDLAALTLTPARYLANDERALITDVLRNIPRPPRSLYELTSAEFMSRASSADIAELVLSEPLVAALVMGKIHSPVFGLTQPITHLGQAITFLGTQTVRSICLRYLMGESFSTSDPGIKKVFDNFGEASTIASELCLRLSNAMKLPDSSSMRTSVILSFTGHLAAAVLQIRRSPGAVPANPGRLLQRVMQQQDELGLAAPEIGRLLMNEWNLPPSMVAGVAAIDHVLVEPARQSGAEDKLAAGVCYLTARLAERLVMGEISSPADIERFLDQDPDFFHVGSYLSGRISVDWRKALLAEETMAGFYA